MILLFTDFGQSGPYLAQMTAAIRHVDHSSQIDILNLFADAPVHDPHASGALLSAYMTDFPAGSVFVCVVDPDVGNGLRQPVFVQAAGRYFVGPNNGLFDLLLLHYPDYQINEVVWQPESISASFHGRDLYAPVAAMLHAGIEFEHHALNYQPDEKITLDLAETIYIDSFGNVMTGYRASSFDSINAVTVNGQRHPYRRTFSDVATGEALAYTNANGLIEIAVNRGRAADVLNLTIGMPVTINV